MVKRVIKAEEEGSQNENRQMSRISFPSPLTGARKMLITWKRKVYGIGATI
jgi:hypothetical protein